MVSQPSQTDRPSSSPFLRLPRELRENIYEYAMDELPTEFSDWISTSFTSHTSPARNWISSPWTSPTLTGKLRPGLCFLNRQIHHEAIHAYIRRTNFILHSKSTYLMMSLLLEKHDAFCSVRSLTLGDTFRFLDRLDKRGGEERRALELISKCTGLRHLTLHLEGRDLRSIVQPLSFLRALAMNNISPSSQVSSPVENEWTLQFQVKITQFYNLLSELPVVQCLELASSQNVGFWTAAPHAAVIKDVLDEFRLWVLDYYASVGRATEVTTRYRW